MSDVDEFKARARATWASGDFPRIARETVADVGPALVGAIGIRTGAKVLDVAAGSGATSIPAALAGGDVVASDLTPELLEAGRHAAIAAQVAIQWVEADAEALPFPDASFDVVLSELSFVRRLQPVTHVSSPDALVDYYRANLGPMVMTFRALEADPARAAELDAELRELARRTQADGRWDFEYLQVVARRAA